MDTDDDPDHRRICACPGCEEEAAAGHGGEQGHRFCHVCEVAHCTPEQARCGEEDLFPLGMVLATPGALIALVRTHQEIMELRLADATTLWIMTEADRSSTCLLLPEES